MAVDTRNKRASAIGAGLPTRFIYPVADGTIAQADRQQSLNLYSGILAISNVEINGNLFANSATFYTGVLTTTYDVTSVKLTNVNTFGANVVARSDATITGVKFTSVNTFYPAVVSASYDITGSLFVNVNSLRGGVVGAPPYEITSTLFSNINTFGTAYVFRPGYGVAYIVRAKRDGYHIKAYGS